VLKIVMLAQRAMLIFSVSFQFYEMSPKSF
jgi:hypothetical protein